MTKTQEKFRSMRRAGTPLIGAKTADPARTVQELATGLETPVASWDIMRGMEGLNPAGQAWADKVNSGDPAPIATANPSGLLEKVNLSAPKEGLLFMYNVPALFDQQDLTKSVVVQGLWNLRDDWKKVGATCVLLGGSFMLPEAIKNDVMILECPLPTAEDISEMVSRMAAENNAEINADKVSRDLLGLPMFTAEQSFATALKKVDNKIVVDDSVLWEQKCSAIRQVKGLSIYEGTETFGDVVGYDNVKEFMIRIAQGPDAPQVYVFIDEIDKAIGGFGTDTSGVSTEMVGQMLTWMQNRKALGTLLIGAPGSGKSLICSSLGNTVKKPTVVFDMSRMKGSLVGQSVEALANAMMTVDGMAGGGRIHIIATCNRYGNMPPEMKRRFRAGTFFFDLPTSEERTALWKHYAKGQEVDFDDDGWTGSEICNCADLQWRLNCSLKEASEYIVPVCKSGAEDIRKLREQAEGQFISASHRGPYKQQMATTAANTRWIKK